MVLPAHCLSLHFMQCFMKPSLEWAEMCLFICKTIKCKIVPNLNYSV